MGEPVMDGIVALATLTARARSPVLYNRRDEIELVPEPEAPGRLANALALLARAIAIVRAERIVSLSTYLLVAQVAQDSIAAPRWAALEAVLAARSATTTEIAEVTGYPTSTARRYLSELVAVGLLDRDADGPGRADRWAPSDRLRTLLKDVRSPLRETDLTGNVGGLMVNE
jgi:DNA-binding MarR family transcriptional regulator